MYCLYAVLCLYPDMMKKKLMRSRGIEGGHTRKEMRLHEEKKNYHKVGGMSFESVAN